MKKTILILLLIISFSTSYAQINVVDTLELKNAYNELILNPKNEANQRRFFKAFPSNWDEYLYTYTYKVNKSHKARSDLDMYKVSHKHVDAFGELTEIPDSIYCAKLIKLAIGGSWDADVPNYLKILLHKKMANKRTCIMTQIAKLRKGNQFQFWQFYWSNIVESKALEKEFENLTQLNSNDFPEENDVMRDAFYYFYNSIDHPFFLPL